MAFSNGRGSPQEKQIKPVVCQAVMAHAFNSSTLESEAGGSLSSQTAWFTQNPVLKNKNKNPWLINRQICKATTIPSVCVPYQHQPGYLQYNDILVPVSAPVLRATMWEGWYERDRQCQHRLHSKTHQNKKERKRKTGEHDVPLRA